MTFVCIHGHFYQPPRENPWLERVHLQDSAFPYHDWNERITQECYAPNTASRIMGDGKISGIVNNYSHMSFNFGPTLLRWMEHHRPDVLDDIIRADREGAKQFSGHGPAIAMCYNHMIMPLASQRDKQTQVKWGIREFKTRFNRDPEGMWLPETGVDLETLEVLADHNIKFTILKPDQAKAVRPIDGGDWSEVPGGVIDHRGAYLCRLPSGKEINLFFYNGPLSGAVSFDRVLEDGAGFADRLIQGLDNEGHINHIATDGETYGHHHHYGEMALTYALWHIQEKKLADVTVYGEYLEKHPPNWEVQIHENTSWSCIHGVDRWRADCGCTTGGHPNWNQDWRAPLREALDWLNEKITGEFEHGLKNILKDPWQARNDYIDVILDRSEGNVERFLAENCTNSSSKLNRSQQITALSYLEASRQAMLMYTSCGWFFEEISGIETVQILRHACRAIQLIRNTTGNDLEAEFLKLLEKAPSNYPEYENGAKVYGDFVKPLELDLARVGGDYAIISLFEGPDIEKLYCYTIKSLEHDRKIDGKKMLVYGKCQVRSNITWEDREVEYCALHLGDHNVICGVIPKIKGDDEGVRSIEIGKLRDSITDHFFKNKLPQLLCAIEEGYKRNYTLWDLFKEEQREILQDRIQPFLGDIQDLFDRAYEDYYPLMKVMRDRKMRLPPEFHTVVSFQINSGIQGELRKPRPDTDRINELMEEASKWDLELETELISYLAADKIRVLAEDLQEKHDPEVLKILVALFRGFEKIDLRFRVWQAQNIVFEMANEKIEKDQEWEENFNTLAQYLGIHLTGGSK